MNQLEALQTSIRLNDAGQYLDTLCYCGEDKQSLEDNRLKVREEILSRNVKARWLRFWEDRRVLENTIFGRCDAALQKPLLPLDDDSCWLEEIT